jgi:hypothetical protein
LNRQDAGKQAKILSDQHIEDLLFFADNTHSVTWAGFVAMTRKTEIYGIQPNGRRFSFRTRPA